MTRAGRLGWVETSVGEAGVLSRSALPTAAFNTRAVRGNEHRIQPHAEGGTDHATFCLK